MIAARYTLRYSKPDYSRQKQTHKESVALSCKDAKLQDMASDIQKRKGSKLVAVTPGSDSSGAVLCKTRNESILYMFTTDIQPSTSCSGLEDQAMNYRIMSGRLTKQ